MSPLTYIGRRAILKEIEEIKAGKWDARIRSSLTGQPADGQHPPAKSEVLRIIGHIDLLAEMRLQSSAVSAGTRGDEPFGGSDLSGVTETSSPSLARVSYSYNSLYPRGLNHSYQDGSETPTVAKVPGSTGELKEDISQLTESGLREQTPTAPTETNDMQVEVEEDTEVSVVAMSTGAAAESEMADDTTAQASDKDTEQLRREEEEEEEDVTNSKPEEEETDHEENGQDAPMEQDAGEEPVKPTEHKPEEEEEEEEIREAPEEHEEMEVEETAPQDTEANSPRAPSEGQKGQEAPEEPEQQAEEAASDEEPAQMTRREFY